MKTILLPVLVLPLFGCAHHSVPKTVHFPYASELLKSIQTASVERAPAVTEPIEAKEEKSPRRVYFSSLYYQYMALGSNLGNKNEIEFCPQFHHDKVESDAYSVPKISVYGAGHVDENGKDYFPELAFSRKFSLKDYHASIKEELQVLCEEGVSDNFYKFDNLVTHYANKKSFHMRPESMESVLKIPIFANFYLIKMIQAQHEVVWSVPDEKQFIKMSQTHWFDRYVVEASRMRNSFLRNKMVKR